MNCNEIVACVHSAIKVHDIRVAKLLGINSWINSSRIMICNHLGGMQNASGSWPEKQCNGNFMSTEWIVAPTE
jgi:hypothetical protein